MKYKYEPNVYIVDYEKLKNMFAFDNNGEFETDDPKLIEWIRKNKPFLKPIDEPVEPQETEQKKYKCKYCNYETENKGELLAHYREHKAQKR
jgi:hypothetical protein